MTYGFVKLIYFSDNEPYLEITCLETYHTVHVMAYFRSCALAGASIVLLGNTVKLSADQSACGWS